MGFLKFIFRHLMNNEQLINKLAESKPMRRSAQFIVYILIRTGMINGTYRPLSSPQDFLKKMRDINEILKQELKEVKDGFKKNPPK